MRGKGKNNLLVKILIVASNTFTLKVICLMLMTTNLRTLLAGLVVVVILLPIQLLCLHFRGQRQYSTQ